MTRQRSRLMIFAILCASFAAGEVCTAAPITVGQAEFEKYGRMGMSASANQASRVASSKATPSPQDVPRKAPSSPTPQQLPSVMVVGLTGQSMSGSPVSTTLVVAAGGVGVTAALPSIPLPIARRTPPGGEWLYFPPRFLDGVFRPPRTTISL